MKMYYNFLNILLCIYIFLFIALPITSKYKVVGLNIHVVLSILMAYYVLGVVLNREIRNKSISSVKRFFKNKCNIVLSLCALWMIFSITYSADKASAISEVEMYMKYLFIYFLIEDQTHNKRYVDNILNSFIFTLIIVSIVTFIDTIKGIGIEQTSEGVNRIRVESLLENSNNLGAFFILFIFPFIMLSIYEKEKRKKYLYIIVSFLCLFNIIVSYSRNAWMAFGVGCLLVVIIYNKKFIVPFLGVFLIGLLIPEISMRLTEFNDFSQNITRIKLWETTLLMIKEHALLGVGVGNFSYQYDNYIKRFAELKYSDYQIFHPHNVFLQVQAELGVIGIILIISLIIFIIMKLRKYIHETSSSLHKNFYRGFYISFIVFVFIMNMVDDFFSAPKIILIFIVIISIPINSKKLEVM
ncbi:O-antigen ligase family protein [Clostridium sp. HMP27]|nr:O-antigen ligase family protein [Clostridium sp. HMP27]